MASTYWIRRWPQYKPYISKSCLEPVNYILTLKRLGHFFQNVILISNVVQN